MCIFLKYPNVAFQNSKISRKYVMTSDILFSLLNREFSSRELFPLLKSSIYRIVKMSSVIISKKIFPTS